LITTHPLTPDRWPALESLFGANGACGGCWCMLWRAPYGGARFAADKGEPNRRKLESLVRAGHAHGCLAYDGDTPVGWVSADFAERFPYFERSRSFTPPPPGTFVVTCFFVPAKHRGRGIATTLLQSAVALAKARKAHRIHGFPVEPHGKTVAAAFAWTGVPALFEAAGFTPVPHEATGKTYYALPLRK
jgi:GNAT superfamily N-acetyltransferase